MEHLILLLIFALATLVLGFGQRSHAARTAKILPFRCRRDPPFRPPD